MKKNSSNSASQCKSNYSAISYSSFLPNSANSHVVAALADETELGCMRTLCSKLEPAWPRGLGNIGRKSQSTLYDGLQSRSFSKVIRSYSLAHNGGFSVQREVGNNCRLDPASFFFFQRSTVSLRRCISPGSVYLVCIQGSVRCTIKLKLERPRESQL